jgi:hypothetical protein
MDEAFMITWKRAAAGLLSLLCVAAVTCPVNGATGTQDLYLRFSGGSGHLVNVNWWQFRR